MKEHTFKLFFPRRRVALLTSSENMALAALWSGVIHISLFLLYLDSTQQFSVQIRGGTFETWASEFL